MVASSANSSGECNDNTKGAVSQFKVNRNGSQAMKAGKRAASLAARAGSPAPQLLAGGQSVGRRGLLVQPLPAIVVGKPRSNGRDLLSCKTSLTVLLVPWWQGTEKRLLLLVLQGLKKLREETALKPSSCLSDIPPPWLITHWCSSCFPAASQ